MTEALCWLALAIWLSVRPRPRLPRRSSSPAQPSVHLRGKPDRPTLSPRLILGLAAAAVVVSCLMLFGFGTGAVLAVFLAPLIVVILRYLQSRTSTGLTVTEAASIPLLLDLAAVALGSGQPLDAALLAAAATGPPGLAGQLRQIAGLLRLGAEPGQAWDGLIDDPRLRPVAVTAIRSAGSGIRLAGGFADLAVELRAGARSAAEARAQRAGVWSIAPLGLCFLPAFVCLGIVPVVIGVAGGILQGVGS
jgi:pilus assembly protein TadC